MNKTGNIETICVREIMTAESAESLKGSYQTDDFCDMIFTSSVDIYIINDDGTKRLLAKFRKNIIPAETVQIGWDNFHKLAKQSLMRGAAAGPIDISGAYFKEKNLISTNLFSTGYINKDGTNSTMRINNPVASSVVGYMDSGKLNNQQPCRLTSLSNKHINNYNRGLPFIEAVDTVYKLLIPDKYKLQKAQADAKPNYRISDTAFSTVTINKNFRTGCHRDAGDFKEGFGNLTVIERGEYSGGFTIFPQYGIGFDVRSSDVLLMDVHELHCNSELFETPQQAENNSKLPKIFKNSKLTGDTPNFTRLSFVCYLRAGLASCPDA
jgi:hypothetical protein